MTIDRHLATRLRPVAFALLAASVGASAATIGLSPAENAAASESAGGSITRVAVESTTASALSRLLTRDGQR